MKYVVTGGAGFIGSATARELIERGHEVTVIDKLTYAGNLSSLKVVHNHPRYTFEKVDILDSETIASILERDQPDVIMHLAAESHVDRSITGAGDFIATNIVGTFSLLEAARNYWEGLEAPRRTAFRFLHVSTDEVYGTLAATGLFTEETPYDPRSPYSASKAASDHLVQAWFHTYGFPVLVSNCSNNYGPYQMPEKLIPLMILNAMHNKELPVYGTGENVRDWLYVDDHVRALILIAEKGKPGETYNVGGHNERTNLDVVNTICGVLDQIAPNESNHDSLIRFVQDRKGHDFRYAIDNNKIRTELGWNAQENFETGLERTVRWYLDNEEWWRPLRACGHGMKRLGVSTKGTS